MNRGVAVNFTVKLEVPAQVYILAIFTTFFVSPGDAPGAITLNVAWMDGKTTQCLPNPSQHIPIYLQ